MGGRHHGAHGCAPTRAGPADSAALRAALQRVRCGLQNGRLHILRPGHRQLEVGFQNCYARYHQAFADCNQSERELQGHESQQLAAETQALAQRTQQVSTRSVGERLQDMHSWKSELQREVEALAAETDLLLAQKQRLEHALDATEAPFSITTDNLQCSQGRQHANLMRDHVETELLKVSADLGGQDLWAQRGGAPGSSCGQATWLLQAHGRPALCA